MTSLQVLADHVIAGLFDVDPAAWPYTWILYAAFMLAAAAVGVGFVALFAGPVTWFERRVAARMQCRIGPNRVGPQGIFQWAADGLKCFLKEDLIPEAADRLLFRVAPYLVFVGLFLTFVVLPFSSHIIAADLSIGILYLMSVTTLVVVGLLMAGWASNSKYALIGGIRATAQLVSYEVPTAFALMTVVIIAGSLSTQGIVTAQGGWPWEWFVFRNPFTFVAFFLFFTSGLAEGNRTPFDMPEGESELVAGYHIEYSGFRFLVFLFAEWANLWVLGAIATLVFVGGWQIPGVSHETIAASTGFAFWGWQLLSVVVFSIKTTWMVFVIIQVRWTLPRLRIDQLMLMCWKFLVPASFVCVLGVLVLSLLYEQGGVVDGIVRAVMCLAGAALFARFFWTVRKTYLVDRENYQRMSGKPLYYSPLRLP